MSVDKQSKQKTAAWTHCGHCEHLGMSLDLTNTPAVFEALVNNVPKERRSISYIERNFIVVYEDDTTTIGCITKQQWELHGEGLIEQSLAQHQQNQGADCWF